MPFFQGDARQNVYVFEPLNSFPQWKSMSWGVCWESGFPLPQLGGQGVRQAQYPKFQAVKTPVWDNRLRLRNTVNSHIAQPADGIPISVKCRSKVEISENSWFPDYHQCNSRESPLVNPIFPHLTPRTKNGGIFHGGFSLGIALIHSTNFISDFQQKKY